MPLEVSATLCGVGCRWLQMVSVRLFFIHSLIFLFGKLIIGFHAKVEEQSNNLTLLWFYYT